MRFCWVLILGLFFVFSSRGLGQSTEPVTVEGLVVNALTNRPVPNAQVVSYGLVKVFVADTLGFFRIEVLPDDSIRATSIGYYPQNFKVAHCKVDSGINMIALQPVSYAIREVTIRGYQGIFDPSIFPKRKDPGPQINLHLPSWIGSQTNPLPPSERELMHSPSIPQAVISPVSFVYSKLSRHERSLRKLHQIKLTQDSRRVWEEILSDSRMGQWVDLEGEELDRFIIYCNIQILVSHRDTELTLYQKVMDLFDLFQKEQ
jgi:hypothetical protein